MVWEPNSCCGCMNPKLGTLVLGWLALISSGLHVLSSLRFAPYGYSDWEMVCDKVIEDNDFKVDTDTCVTAVMTWLIVGAVASSIGVIISILLIVGVNKTKPMMMLPFMICQVMEITLLGILGLVVFVIFLFAGYFGAASFFATIIGFIMFLMTYFFLVVRVCYKEVKQHAMGMSTDCSIPYVEQVSFPYKN